MTEKKRKEKRELAGEREPEWGYYFLFEKHGEYAGQYVCPECGHPDLDHHLMRRRGRILVVCRVGPLVCAQLPTRVPAIGGPIWPSPKQVNRGRTAADKARGKMMEVRR